jgi:8-oxo-dGTP pyrophosphatase MutT (NUDIX family)
MPISPYVHSLRKRVGTDRLLLPSVTALVHDDAGSLLLVRQRDGQVWSTPGGTIEPDESPADAVVRETWEETGLLVEPLRLTAVHGGPEFVVRYPNGDEAQYVMVCFECVAVSGAPRADGDETLAVRYWSAADAAALRLAPWLRHSLASFYEQREAAGFTPARWRPARS